MQSRLLIINCPSEYFFYIPMGTFGLCDYLKKKNIQVKLLNLAVYKEPGMQKVLEHYLKLFQPTHAGIIFHWQETAEGFLRIGKQIRSVNKDVKIIAGGFTAGYFGENLLERCPFLNFVIKGDPEKPLKLLMEGAEISEIPNLIHRSISGIRSNEVSYFIDQETLSSISFSDLSYLYDYELYISAMNKKLGFPVFIGRGCVHDCRYCGGSCGAFRLHSARVRPVVRTIQSVIEDLKRLKDFTRKIYLCYENDLNYIKALFHAMKKEQDLIKTFDLNYGAWQLPDEELLNLYKNLFIPSANLKPVVELSPEVFDDEGRKKIKKSGVYYSIDELKENLSLINRHLGDSINVSIFFSRYHDTAKTYAGIKKEISGIFRLKHDLLRDNYTSAMILYDHLSTDVASRYWEDYVKQPKDFDTLISALKFRTLGQKSFPVDNLCVYIPETLTESEIFRCELLIFILKNLEKYTHEMFHIMFKCMDELMIDIIEDIIFGSYAKKLNVFTSFDHNELLALIKQKIVKNKSLSGKIPFAGDMIDLEIKKVLVQQKTPDRASSSAAGKPRLNRELISVHDHDYLDLGNFLKRIDKGEVGNLKPEKTAYIFLTDEILTIPHETFELTLKEFEKGVSVDEYYKKMKKRGIFTPSYHKNLIDKLFKSNVLF